MTQDARIPLIPSLICPNWFLAAPASPAPQQDSTAAASQDHTEANVCWLWDCPVKKEAGFFSKDKAVTIHFPKYFMVCNVYLIQVCSI